MEKRGAKVFRGCRAVCAAEIVQKVCESGIPEGACVSVINRSLICRGGTLCRQLSQIFQAVTKRVAAAQLRLLVLKQQVIDMSELQKAEAGVTCCSLIFEVGER